MDAGHSYRLKIKRVEPGGAWLEGEDREIFLPRKECDKPLAAGMQIEAFLYTDRDATLCATCRKPLAEVGQFALLEAVSSGPHGTFVDWGIGKDLLVPFSEQAQKMLEGRRYLVRVCLDKAGRPIGSTRLEKFLQKENQDLQSGDQVDLLIWAFTDLGAKVIVNDHYEALLYRDEITPQLKRGRRCRGFILRIRDDLRIDVSLRRPGAAGVDDARQVILDALQPSGFLPLHDLSPPEEIRARLGLSKKVFKKAVGGLYKDGLVTLTGKGIKRKER